MIITELKDLTFNTTNVPDDTTAQWDAEVNYAIDTIRQLNNKLYKALDKIDLLCKYVYDDTDILNPNRVYKALDDVEVLNTAVPCILNETVVYEKETALYYLFDNAGGGLNVDFTTIVLATSPYFTALIGYRYEVYNPETTPLKWEDLGYTNKYRMLDASLSTQTSYEGDMEMSFILTKADSVYLFNVLAISATISIYNNTSNTLIKSETIALIGKSKGSIFGFFFYDYNYKNRLYLRFNASLDVRVEITLNKFGDFSKCGLIGIGLSETWGGTKWGATGGITDFSKKEVNANGETYLEVGSFKAYNNVTIELKSGLSDDFVRRLTELRAKPVVYQGSEIYDTTLLYGIYNKWEILLSLPTLSIISMDLESLLRD